MKGWGGDCTTPYYILDFHNVFLKPSHVLLPVNMSGCTAPACIDLFNNLNTVKNVGVIVVVCHLRVTLSPSFPSSVVCCYYAVTYCSSCPLDCLQYSTLWSS